MEIQGHQKLSLCGEGLIDHTMTNDLDQIFLPLINICAYQRIVPPDEKVLLLRRKHCGKMRNCSLRAILLFPQCFQKTWIEHT